MQNTEEAMVHGKALSFYLLVSAPFLDISQSQGAGVRQERGITFWIERLIINLAEKLGLINQLCTSNKVNLRSNFG